MVVMVVGDFISPDGKPFRIPQGSHVYPFAQRPNIPNFSQIPRKNIKKKIKEFVRNADGPTSYFVKWGVFGNSPEELKGGIDMLFDSVKSWRNIKIYSRDDMSDAIHINRRIREKFGAMAKQIREAGFDLQDPGRPAQITHFIEKLFDVTKAGQSLVA